MKPTYRNALQKSAYFFLLTGIIFFAGYQLTYSQTRKVLVPHLQANKLDLTKQNLDWPAVFNENFYQNQVFLLGERHGIAYSYEALWILFQQLKAKTNFTYYLLESPLYWETCLNKYLETGDEALLNKPFLLAKGTFYANQNFYDFYKKLYAYNKALPQQDKIHFISVDVEHQFQYSHAQLLALFARQVKNKQDTCQFIRLFYRLNPRKTGNYRQAYQQYLKAFNRDSTQLKNELGADYPTAQYLIRNINYKFIASADPTDLVRDSLMYENFKTRTRLLDFRHYKAFGFLGLSHCYLSSTKKVKYFGAYLENKDYKCTSLIMLYSNCTTRIPTFYLPKPLRFLGNKEGYFETTMRSNDQFIEHQKYIGVLKKLAPSAITLFRLTGEQSPFEHRSLLIDELKSDQPTTSYMQYVILIKDSPAAASLQLK